MLFCTKGGSKEKKGFCRHVEPRTRFEIRTEAANRVTSTVMGGKTHNCEFTPEMGASFDLRDKEMKDGSLQEEAKRCGVPSN